MEDREYRLITAYFERTIDDSGLTELQLWIDERPEHLEAFINTLKVLEASAAYLGQPVRMEQSWVKVKAHSEAGALKRFRLRGLKSWPLCAAASLLLAAVAIAMFGYRFSPADETPVFAEISNPEGQQSRILLPDSSVVYLAGGSRIRYKKGFSGMERDIHLEGEAFFDVVHRPDRPFVVKSGNISTVVLGTSFNVRAFRADDKIVVTVKTGRVGVMSSNSGRQQLLRYLVPDEQIEINTATGLYTFSDADAVAVSAWVRNEFIFYNMPLREIVSSLEHRYGVSIEFTDEELGKGRYTAKFRNMPLKAVLDDLSLISGLDYTLRDNQVFITKQHQKGGKIMK